MTTGSLPSDGGGDSPFQVDTSAIDMGGGGGLGGGGRSQREKIMIAALIAIIVIGGGILAVKKLHKGTPQTSTTSTTFATSGTQGTTASNGGTGSLGGASSSGGTGAASASTTAPLAPYQVYISRDPFVPIALPIGTGTAALYGNTITVSTTSTTPSVVPPGGGTVPGGSTTSTSTTLAGPSAPPQTTHTIELISVYVSNGQPTGNVTVDGTAYTVYDGSTFATNFTVVVLDVSSNCGTFLYADYEFELCQGQQATV